MTEYRFAASQDWPRIIDFIDLVFSQAARPHDFAELIPKVYGDGHDYSRIHAIALEDGEIRGCVAVLPFDMAIAGQPLHVGYLGSVSVHRLSRGAGHMKKLMQMQIDKAKTDGLDMIVLGGQRQRYGYFGFEPAGGQYHYQITSANVRHALANTDASGISFEPLVPGKNSDYAHALYQQQPVCGSRTAKNFAEIALTFHMRGWVVKKDGDNAGYLIAANGHTEIHELVMEDAALIPAVIKAWMAAYGVRSLSVSAAPHNTALNRALAVFAEYYTIGPDGCVLCLCYQKVIRRWMTLKNSVSPMAEGTLRIGIEQERLEIRVAGGAVSVEQTNLPVQLQLSASEASQLLFGFNRFYAPSVNCAIPADWFPLPLSIPTADTF